jgi:hypothetical protein
MRIGRENRSIRRKPAPESLLPPPDLIWPGLNVKRLGARLSAWATARPFLFYLIQKNMERIRQCFIASLKVSSKWYTGLSDAACKYGAIVFRRSEAMYRETNLILTTSEQTGRRSLNAVRTGPDVRVIPSGRQTKNLILLRLDNFGRGQRRI